MSREGIFRYEEGEGGKCLIKSKKQNELEQSVKGFFGGGGCGGW